MEPGDGGQDGGDPVVGWRVWRVENNRLCAIAKLSFWEPGENRATCLAGHDHDVPAPSCHCGFWATNSPLSSILRALAYPSSQSAVGLIRGYGAIAVHGVEGFRAALASVVCIFSDAPLDRDNPDARRAVAEKYGVPCISLKNALSIGFLQEMGVPSSGVKELDVWMAAGRPLPTPQQPPASGRLPSRAMRPSVAILTRREQEIALLVAKGMTSAQIANYISLNSRAVDYHLYRAIEKAGVRNTAELASWVARSDAYRNPPDQPGAPRPPAA